MRRIIILTICMLASGAAWADFELSPLRNVLTAARPTATFTISNSTTHILEGRITWLDLTPTEDGYDPASPAARAKRSAAPYLVVSPADFRLEPGGRADVQVTIRPGVTPPPGERRSHLLFETSAARSLIRKAADTGLQTDIGLSISAPVILRNGLNAKSRIGDTYLDRSKNGGLELVTVIEAAGEISTFGELHVGYFPHNGAPRRLGVIGNISAYLDGAARQYRVPLGQEWLNAGKLEIKYIGASEFEGQIFDTRIFDIAPPDESVVIGN